MKAKKLMTTVLAASAVLAMSVNAMAASSITNAPSAWQTISRIPGTRPSPRTDIQKDCRREESAFYRNSWCQT